MPVRALMPNADFKREWLKQNPDLTCRQRGCNLIVGPPIAKSIAFSWAFDVAHNGKKEFLSSDVQDVSDHPEVEAIRRVAQYLDKLHYSQPEPAEDLLIVRV